MKKLYVLASLSLLLSFSFHSYAQCGIYPDNGQIAIAVPDGIINTYFPGQGNPVSGNTVLTVGQMDARGYPVGLTAGDIVLIIQMQGADINSSNSDAYGDGVAGGNGSGYMDNAGLVAGNYEFNVISEINSAGPASTTFTLSYPLVNNYYSRTYAAGGIRTYQVIRGFKFYDLLIGASASLTAPAWNGSTGGVVALSAANRITIQGAISVAGKGFRGGGGKNFASSSAGLLNTDYRWNSPLTSPGNTTGGAKGEGIAGTPAYTFANGTTTVTSSAEEGYPDGSMGRGAPGNAGGGGTDGTPNTNGYNTGGGGGANGGTGGRGGSGWHGGTGDVNSYPYGGHGGSPFAQATLSRIVMGGGGGAGSANNSTLLDEYMSSGGAGGGIVILWAKSFSGTGSINADGAGGVGVITGGTNTDAAGGGGAGGSIVAVISDGGATATGLDQITLSAQGGAGGNMAAYWDHGPGGGGSGGVIITHADAGAASVAGGTNGLTHTGNTGSPLNNSFGAAPGTAGNLVNVPVGIDLVNPYFLSPCGILPVVLIRFDAALRANDEVALSWEVENAINFDHFEVEYSTDGRSFTTIRRLPFYESQSHYETTHTDMLQTQHYYRLKMVDRDGKIAYSKILMVRTSATGKGLIISPQPAREYIHLAINAEKNQQTRIELFSINGKKVKTISVRLEKARNFITITGLAELPAGLYALKTVVDGKVITGKVVLTAQ